ncbi:GMC family oxidoreductase [Bradyrhizobium sp. IC3195]|uniref:GMC oxidoreductase n=1 Tax=Bradyrhizobium sp. IC3195 TaxID=2793804 RepID=UPI001CD48D3C|nr:GMC oxidoreductase [Bradyrhizobium sp. IC3195]MCA1469229.1 GMC family oxidoreductase [Bradyrhizobium sp. IC3195]
MDRVLGKSGSTAQKAELSSARIVESMLIRFRDISDVPIADFCVVGAGPAGIALALALADFGHSVLLVESGEETPTLSTRELTWAELRNKQTHAPSEIASCRAFGGTSWWWGGRCVPFDQVDFEHRPFAPGTEWPLSYNEMTGWYSKAAEFLNCGTGTFEKEPGDWAQPGQISISIRELERWTPDTNLQRTYLKRVRESQAITLLLGATLTDIHLDKESGQVREISLADRNKATKASVRVCILACGGLETTRIMLLLKRKYSTILPSADAVLGKFYMGHISGKIADVVFSEPELIDEFDFFTENGHFARRRFTLSKETLKRQELLNIAFWTDNPPFHDASHGSGILSAVWLMLATPCIGRRLVSEGVRVSHVGPGPYTIKSHLINIVRSPTSVLSSAMLLLHERYLSSPRKPGFLVRNKGGRYALHYHAEQLPTKNSYVTLSDELDPLGVPRLAIDFNYSELDARSVVRAHRILDQFLRSSRAGYLAYRAAQEELVTRVMEQASDGYHQLGTTRMGRDPASGIVDENCKVHGTRNLFLLSGSVFPSSGQANPTFLIVALAFRLASHLAAASNTLAARSVHAAV